MQKEKIDNYRHKIILNRKSKNKPIGKQIKYMIEYFIYD
jgi:hypothetical protein